MNGEQCQHLYKKELYNLHIYLYTVYKSLSSQSQQPPHNLKVISSRSKNLTTKERINSLSFLSVSRLQYYILVLQMKTETKHTKKSY